MKKKKGDKEKIVYFCVTAKCGHVGRNFYLLKDFAVSAKDAKEAAKKVRWYSRVKHHHKDAIRCVVRISREEFITLRQQNEQDEYLKCKNVQEQNKIEGLMELVHREEKNEFKKERNTKFIRKKQRILIEETNNLIRNFAWGI